MPLLFPPDGWEVTSGTWGTDMDESTSVLKSGIRSLWYKNTTPAADPEMRQIRNHWVEVEGGGYYKAEAVLRASSIAGGNTVKAAVEWLDTAGTVLSTGTIHNAVLLAADTWETKRAVLQAHANARFARVIHGKNNTAFHAYVDMIGLEAAKPSLRAYLDAAAQAINTSFEIVIFDGVDEEIAIDYNPATGVATILVPGLYNIYAQVEWADIDIGVETALQITHIPVGAGSTPIRFNRQYGDGNISTHQQAVVTKRLAEGDQIRVQVDQDSGAAENIDPGLDRTVFEMHLVE